MSIASRKRNQKQPTSTVNDTHAPQPYKHHVPQKLYGLFRPDSKKQGGAFGGCTQTERRRRKELRESKQAVAA